MTVLSAEDLRQAVTDNQLTLIFKEIFESAKKFKTSVCISSEIKLKEGVIDHLKELGYDIKIRFYANDVKSEYRYLISWEEQ